VDPNDSRQSASAARTAAPVQCEECGSPVEEEQRYCVVCGAHRRHVADPAARYLSQASARSRTKRVAATARRAPRTAAVRTSGLGLAVALALIPAAAAVGVLAGRSSNNDDAKLVTALSRQQAAAERASSSAATTRTIAAGASTTTAGGASKPGKSTHTGNALGIKGAVTVKGKGKGKPKAASHQKAVTPAAAKSSSGAAISTAPPSAAQKAAGSKATQQVQKSKGTAYTKSQTSLPGTVVVP
jgi:hypothetical protein